MQDRDFVYVIYFKKQKLFYGPNNTEKISKAYHYDTWQDADAIARECSLQEPVVHQVLLSID